MEPINQLIKQERGDGMSHHFPYPASASAKAASSRANGSGSSSIPT